MPQPATTRDAARRALSHALLLLCSCVPGLAWPAAVCAVPLLCLRDMEACSPKHGSQCNDCHNERSG